MRRVAVVSAAQYLVEAETALDSSEMAFAVAREAVAASGFARDEIGLTVSASSDVLEGRPFHFLQGIEALGVWPATSVTHVEMDGAWAAYYAWIRILAGSCDTALVVAWSKTSEASIHHVTNAQLDPFCLAPLGLDDTSSAALQAGAYLARAGLSLDAVDAVSGRTTVSGDAPVATPLWRRHCPRWADGACAVVLAAEDALDGRDALAWIAGADHRSEPGALGHRDLSTLPSARIALAKARDIAGWTGVDIAEIGSAYAHQELLLREVLELDDVVSVNASGGPMAAHPMMATGLIRVAEASTRIAGTAQRALAHAATGHALQQNIVFLLEGGAA